MLPVGQAENICRFIPPVSFKGGDGVPSGVPLFTGAAHKPSSFPAHVRDRRWYFNACDRRRFVFLRPELDIVGFLHGIRTVSGKEDWCGVYIMCRSCPGVRHFSSQIIDRSDVERGLDPIFLVAECAVWRRRHWNRDCFIRVSVDGSLCTRTVRSSAKLIAWIRVRTILRICVLLLTHRPDRHDEGDERRE